MTRTLPREFISAVQDPVSTFLYNTNPRQWTIEVTIDDMPVTIGAVIRICSRPSTPKIQFDSGLKLHMPMPSKLQVSFLEPSQGNTPLCLIRGEKYFTSIHFKIMRDIQMMLLENGSELTQCAPQIGNLISQAIKDDVFRVKGLGPREHGTKDVKRLQESFQDLCVCL